MNASLTIPSPSCPPPSRLDAFFDRELPEPERAGIESHLAACDACRQSLEQIESASALVKSIELPAMSPIGRARVLRELTDSAASASSAGRDRWLLPVRLLTAVAAAIFLIATGLIVYQLRHTDSAPGGTAPVQPIVQPQPSPGAGPVHLTGATNPSRP